MQAPQALFRSLAIFASGRLAAVALGFAFQLVVVRVLPLGDYAAYAVAMAAALLAQSLLLFGIPTVIAYEGSARAAAGDGPGLRRLLGRIAAVRLVVIGFVVAAVAVLRPVIDVAVPVSGGGLLVMATVVWAAALLAASDAESVCQIFGQQRLSRAVAVGEPLIRLAGLLAFTTLAQRFEAALVVMLCAATASLAALVLIGAAAWGSARMGAVPGDAPAPAQQDLVALAGASYLSTAGAMVMSPPAVRLVTATAMPVEVLAAFSFMQGLMLSCLRLTSGIVLSPFIEPAVMGHMARSGAAGRMAAALSLVFKLDVVVFSTVIVGLTAGGPAMLALLAGGRFAGFDAMLPVLFLLPALYGLYRSLETAAAVMACRRALAVILPTGVFWLGVLALAGMAAPLAAALLVPLADIASRLAILGGSLRGRGVRGICDPSFLLFVAGSGLATGLAGRLLAGGLGQSTQLAVAALAATLHLGLVLLRVRRLPSAEHEIVAAALPQALRFMPAPAGAGASR